MSTLRWVGRAPAVAQVDTIQITADDASTVYSVTIGGVTVEVAGSGTGVNDTATALQAALAAATHPYFAAVLWQVATDTVTATGSALGEPFTLTAAATGGTGTLSHTAEATQAESANHFNVAANWSGGAVPSANDEIIFDKGAVPLLWAIDQNALSLDLVRTDMSYTGWIGLNPWGFVSNGVELTTVPEYRETHFKVAADRIEIGRESGIGTGAGQGRVNIDNTDTGTPVCQVFATAAVPKDAGQLAIDYVPHDAQATLVINNAPGGVGVAARLPGTTATLASCDVATTNPSTRVVVGEGVTLTNYRQNQGQNVLSAAADIAGVVRVSGGRLTTLGEEFTIASLIVFAGTVVLNHFDSTTPATAITLYANAVLDLLGNYRPRTLASVAMVAGSKIRLDTHITITSFGIAAEAGEISLAKPS